MKVIVAGVLLLALLKGDVTAAPSLPKYPVLFAPLPIKQLNLLRTQFAKENPTVCAEVNRYGLLSATPSCPANAVHSDIEDEDAALDRVSDWLTAHSRFTGYTGRMLVELAKLTEIKGCDTCTPPVPEGDLIELRLYFPRQIMYDLPVEGDVNPMVVYVNAKGIFRVDGFWLPDAPLPLRNTIPSTEARGKLMGMKLPSGGGNAGATQMITGKDLTHLARRVVFARETGHGLEVRVAWKIPVGLTVAWMAYVDAVTGEVLRLIPTPKADQSDKMG
ncbi:MAG TPA: hypothetical protein VML36_05665 [Nitrospiria bacterium]|nr:hypothetical protein [Nitrospiria bacterium]